MNSIKENLFFSSSLLKQLSFLNGGAWMTENDRIWGSGSASLTMPAQPQHAPYCLVPEVDTRLTVFAF